MAMTLDIFNRKITMNDRDTVIVDGLRTPFGQVWAVLLPTLSAVKLASPLIKELVEAQ
jgi:acetyl-CoA acetyltransferase